MDEKQRLSIRPPYRSQNEMAIINIPMVTNIKIILKWYNLLSNRCNPYIRSS